LTKAMNTNVFLIESDQFVIFEIKPIKPNNHENPKKKR
jgi:hypothetical protein